MGLVISRVAVERLVVHWHGSIGSNAERPKELLEIGPVILIMAKGDAQGRLPPHQAAIRPAVFSLEADRGRIIMEAIQA